MPPSIGSRVWIPPEALADLTGPFWETEQREGFLNRASSVIPEASLEGGSRHVRDQAKGAMAGTAPEAGLGWGLRAPRETVPRAPQRSIGWLGMTRSPRAHGNPERG